LILNSKNVSKWERLGLIFEPNRDLQWSKTHAMLPTPTSIDGKQLIFYSGRNKLNQSSIGFFEVNLDGTPEVTYSSSEPIFSPGDLGCFDDNGVSPSCILELSDGNIAMYYIGWNPGSTTRVNLFGGLAISTDRGKSFKRWSRAPILERNITDPFINTAPWVVKVSDGYRMYYVSGVEWVSSESPRYNIKVAFSSNGYTWERNGQVVLDFQSEIETALARPFVIFHQGIWKMWVTRRIGEYGIAYAESSDGINWVRLDDNFGLLPNGSLEETVMNEYPAVVIYKDEYFMFYNGDDYGKNGILLSKAKF